MWLINKNIFKSILVVPVNNKMREVTDFQDYYTFRIHSDYSSTFVDVDFHMNMSLYKDKYWLFDAVYYDIGNTKTGLYRCEFGLKKLNADGTNVFTPLKEGMLRVIFDQYTPEEEAANEYDAIVPFKNTDDDFLVYKNLL